MKNKEQLAAEGRRLGLSDSTINRYVKIEQRREKEQAREERKMEKAIGKLRTVLVVKGPQK